MNNKLNLPSIVQSVGISCIPRPGMSDICPKWMSRMPVVAAVVTLRRRDDGHIDVDAQTMSEARTKEFPLTWLLDQTLEPGALTLIASDDRAVLQLAASARRFFSEPHLVRMLVDPCRTIDPCAMAEGFDQPTLNALAKALDVPIVDNSAADNKRLWDRKCVAPIEMRALGTAVSQLIVGCTIGAFQHSDPALFFPQMLALRDWLADQPDGSELAEWTMSRPIMRAVSYQREFRVDQERRAAGKPRLWPQFRDGLFHT